MKLFKSLSLVAALTCGLSTDAMAIGLTPGDADFSGSIPGNPDANDVEDITGYAGDLFLAYKADVGSVDNPATIESGGFAGSYSSTFDNEPLDPQDATITYTGGASISGDPIYLLVKDGNHDPIWYIFDITDTWNGIDTINLTGFWPQGGAISHVSIFSPGGSSVPDGGSSLALLGLGIMSLTMLRRKLKA